MVSTRYVQRKHVTRAAAVGQGTGGGGAFRKQGGRSWAEPEMRPGAGSARHSRLFGAFSHN